jgi:hypothetical protein
MGNGEMIGIPNQATIENATPCSICGCKGNMLCGHPPLAGDDCALDECLVCPCCGSLDAQ